MGSHGEDSPRETGESVHYGTFHLTDERNDDDDDEHCSPTNNERVEHAEGPARAAASRTYIYVYCSHFLSAWGDRMWSFGVGLFLVRITGDSLQLPAAYGLASGLTIFLLGALLGDWVDSTPRLRAAQASLVSQNVLVAVCAACVYAFLWFEPSIQSVPGDWLVPLCHAAVIVTAVLADLASVARVISVERDWIVKICDTDTDMLAKVTVMLRSGHNTLTMAQVATEERLTHEMTATLRRIDQTTLIVAPVATGEIVAYTGLQNGALFIGGWNLCSVAVEYFLMWKVFTVVPQLAQKGTGSSESGGNKVTTTANGPEAPEDHSASRESRPQSPWQHSDTDRLLDGEDGTGCCRCRCSCWVRAVHKLTATREGWKAYMRYSVSLAGLALACLYMTVLGFDNITVAYAVTQGVSEDIVGILMAVAAVFGMVGTFVYPVMRRRIGLVRTGLISLSCQVVCLSLCVASIWMPGSPFDPTYGGTSSDTPTQNFTSPVDVFLSPNDTTLPPPDADGGPSHNYDSVIFLMAGIVLARFGLWTADLSITQLFLEAVVEEERGVVNGVQNALNKLMDVLKFLLVVLVPDTETFGFLILLSFLFVCMGWLLYAVFLRRERGHLLPKCCSCVAEYDEL